ncbi:hypothetical protein H1C71_012198 [Ictidomys tridecemlineatus]|nr:hypothetical protein H1C71_012198 [Ictidomys tridecemlineatus]
MSRRESTMFLCPRVLGVKRLWVQFQVPKVKSSLVFLTPHPRCEEGPEQPRGQSWGLSGRLRGPGTVRGMPKAPESLSARAEVPCPADHQGLPLQLSSGAGVGVV